MSEYTPITGELRGLLADMNWTEIIDHMQMSSGAIVDGDWLDHWHEQAEHVCDAIDAIHAQLERENESLKAELNRVLGEQEEHAHTRGESITGELREVAAKTECANGRCEKLYRGDLERIADCIDVEYKRAVMSAMNDALYHANDENMAELGWVRLPKDADGKPVHIDDVMEWPMTGETFEVVGIGDGVLFYVEDGHELADWTGSSTKRHYAPDTWERIIEDACKRAVDGYPDETGHIAMTDLVARCKALCERTKGGDAK